VTELNFDRIVNLNAESDKKTSLNIGVWKGNASLTIFADGRQAVRIPLNRHALVSLEEGLSGILAAAQPSTKTSWAFNKWDNETKKSSQLGAVYIGRDDKALLYVGIQAPGITSLKFPIKTPISFDKGENPLSDLHRSELGGRTLLKQLSTDIPFAILLTSEKRTDMRTGGNGGGGNGNNGGTIF
jgi:hypothetical protein